MHRVTVIGARGHTGAELLPLLYGHPEFRLVAVGSGSAAGQPVSAHVRGMEGSDLVFADLRPRSVEKLRTDACVLALPNGLAARYVEAFDRHHPEAVIVDLSADHRFDPEWAYGQPERFADQLSGARRIANPGFRATAGPARLHRDGTIRMYWPTTCCRTGWWSMSTSAKSRFTSAMKSAFCRTWRRSSAASA
jgi:N-acetyl-gamma-glutamylphosphate reductase